MKVSKAEVVPIRNANDVMIARQLVRQWALDLRFNLVEQTKLVTAASEVARNTLEYGKGGTMTTESVIDGSKAGVRLIFEDRGPGIPDIEKR